MVFVIGRDIAEDEGITQIVIDEAGCPLFPSAQGICSDPVAKVPHPVNTFNFLLLPLVEIIIIH